MHSTGDPAFRFLVRAPQPSPWGRCWQWNKVMLLGPNLELMCHPTHALPLFPPQSRGEDT